MYTRSESMTLSIPTCSFYQENQFGYSRPMRNKEPEIFTFEQIPPELPQRTLRPKKRNTRVMYPANVRKYLPPAETNRAKRWLVILCLVVLWQIYTEDVCVETATINTDSPIADTQYQVLPFLSAEEQARQLTDADGVSEVLAVHRSSGVQVPAESTSSLGQFMFNSTCPSLQTKISSMYKQSTRNGYVVALLVYHRLGSDN